MKQDIQACNDGWLSRLGAKILFVIGAIFACVPIYASFVGALAPGAGTIIFIVCLVCFGGGALLLIKGKVQDAKFAKYQEYKKAQQEIEKKKEEERLLELNRQAKEGTLKINFPANRFYKLCSESNITELNNDFSIRKAVLIAEQLIKEANPEIELLNCGSYLTKEKLEKYFKSGEVIEKELERMKILEMKKPRNGSLTTSEKTFIDRAF